MQTAPAAATAAVLVTLAVVGVVGTSADSRCAPDAAVSYLKSGTTYQGTVLTVTPAGLALVQRSSPATTQETLACSALTFTTSTPTGPTGVTGPTGPTGPGPTGPVGTTGPTGALTNGCTGSTTVITQNTSGKIFRCQVIVRGNGLTISGNKFEGTGRAAKYSQPDVQVWAQNVTGLTFSGNELTGNNMHALLYASGSRDLYISRNDFHDTGTLDPAKANLSHAIYFDGCAACRIVNNRITDVTSYGVQLGDDGANDVQIDNNLISGVGQSGVILWANTNRTLITQNWFRDNRGSAVTSYQLTGSGNAVAAPNWATGTGATLGGNGYTKGALTLGAPPSSWTTPAEVRY